MISTSLQGNERSSIKKFVRLIPYLLYICKQEYRIPTTCLNMIEFYCGKIALEMIDYNATLIDMKKVTNEIKQLLLLMDFNDKQKEKIRLILDDF